ncbi:MAG: histidine kinase [Bacteroidota bacterium]
MCIIRNEQNLLKLPISKVLPFRFRVKRLSSQAISYLPYKMLLALLCLLIGLQSHAQHLIQKGDITLEIEVRYNGAEIPIDSLCDGFDPETNNPINLVIPLNSAIFTKPGPAIAGKNFLVHTRGPRYMNEWSKSPYSLGYPGSKSTYSYIDEANGDTLHFSWQIDYAEVKLLDLYPADYFANYLSFQFQNAFETYPDSSQYDWRQKEYLAEFDARGLPIHPQLPYGENGLFFVVDNITEDALIQLKGYHEEAIPYDDSKPFELFLYNDLAPGDYEFVVKPFAGASEDRNLSYPFTIIAPWWQNVPTLIAVTFFATVLVAGLLFLIYRRRQRKRELELQWKQQLSEAELKAIRAQLNPHFLFNALSSIQNLVVKQNNEAALSYLTKLSRLLRNVLSASEHTFHELRSELDLVELYLNLESLRFSFDYKINIGEGVDLATLTPVMLLQPYVENAVKHGVAGRKDGLINVDIQARETALLIEVKDNGPGMSEPKQGSAGLQLSKDRVQPLNQLYGQAVLIEVGERKDESGVCVRISLPRE